MNKSMTSIADHSFDPDDDLSRISPEGSALVDPELARRLREREPVAAMPRPAQTLRLLQPLESPPSAEVGSQAVAEKPPEVEPAAVVDVDPEPARPGAGDGAPSRALRPLGLLDVPGSTAVLPIPGEIATPKARPPLARTRAGGADAGRVLSDGSDGSGGAAHSSRCNGTLVALARGRNGARSPLAVVAASGHSGVRLGRPARPARPGGRHDVVRRRLDRFIAPGGDSHRARRWRGSRRGPDERVRAPPASPRPSALSRRRCHAVREGDDTVREEPAAGREEGRDPRPREEIGPAPPRAAAEPRRFAWAPVDGATRYHVELFRGSDRVLARETVRPTLELGTSWSDARAGSCG